MMHCVQEGTKWYTWHGQMNRMIFCIGTVRRIGRYAIDHSYHQDWGFSINNNCHVQYQLVKFGWIKHFHLPNLHRLNVFICTHMRRICLALELERICLILGTPGGLYNIRNLCKLGMWRKAHRWQLHWLWGSNREKSKLHICKTILNRNSNFIAVLFRLS